MILDIILRCALDWIDSSQSPEDVGCSEKIGSKLWWINRILLRLKKTMWQKSLTRAYKNLHSSLYKTKIWSQMHFIQLLVCLVISPFWRVSDRGLSMAAAIPAWLRDRDGWARVFSRSETDFEFSTLLKVLKVSWRVVWILIVAVNMEDSRFKTDPMIWHLKSCGFKALSFFDLGGCPHAYFTMLLPTTAYDNVWNVIYNESAEQQESSSNITKYCACHAKLWWWFMVLRHEMSFTMRGATGVILQHHQIKCLPWFFLHS